jgi:hypothetical protein
MAYILSSSSYCCSVLYFIDSKKKIGRKTKFRAQIRRNSGKAEKSDSDIPIRSESITHSDRIRGRLQPLFLTYSARTQSLFGPNRRKNQKTSILSQIFSRQLLYLFGPNGPSILTEWTFYSNRIGQTGRSARFCYF